MAPVTEEISKVLTLRERQNDDLKRESKRIQTFSQWPVSFLKAADLAKDGFYFTNVDDVVKCTFCKMQIGLWEEGDDPHKVHLKLSPNCPFLTNESCGNVSLTDDLQDDVEDNKPVSQDVCGMYPLQIRPFSGPERSNKDAFCIDSSNLWRDFEALGVSKIREPVDRNFATYESRLQTFEKWTAHDIQMPEKLAEAGFYYVGPEDNVLCFHCGGGLKNWEKGEDPWVEHARWFHKCHFVVLQKGRDFIHEVLLTKKAAFSAEAARAMLNARPSLENASDESEDIVENFKNAAVPSQEVAASPSCSSVFSPPNKNEPKLLRSNGKEIQLCRICYTRERELVFLPCGHFVCCSLCTSSLTKCAVCRDPFQATVRAYLC